MRTRTVASSLVAGLTLAGMAHAQVVLDGSLGPAGPLSGPNVIVPASAGTTVGSNLFHSFTRLDVAAGESVTFTGPGTVANVLARVTGGSPTNINGAFRCDIQSADLYLINPAGVVFGPGATLEVRGSFAVTSADFVRLGADGRFDARVPAQSVLTVSAPAAFGFATPGPGAVEVNGGNLGVGTSRSVSVVGGDVRIVNGQILDASGTINIASVRSGEATLTPSPRGPVVQAVEDGGAVEILDGTLIDASGQSPGLVTIRGGSLVLRGAPNKPSAIVSDTLGSESSDPGRAVDIEVTGPLAIGPRAAIGATASGNGSGGDVRVKAADMTIDGLGDNNIDTIGIGTRTSGAGTGGSIELDVNSLVLTNGADLGATSQGTGRGGDIRVTAAQRVELTGASQIFAQARASGRGGDVVVDVAGGPVVLDGINSAILSSTDAATSGAGGRIDLAANELSVRDGAFVSATTNGTGDAGDIAIVADTVDLDGAGRTGDVFTGVGANTQFGGSGAGRGGSVNVTARTLTIREGAGVATRTSGGQNGGNIALDLSKDLLIDARQSRVQTGLNAAATGPGVNGGRIAVAARRVELHRGQITASAEGDGGEITIQAPDFVHLFDLSEIVAEAVGNGGNVTIDPVSVVLDRSRISANAIQGNGGNILISTQAFIASADPETSVTASSEFGLVGTVEINAPDTEIAGALVRLPGALATGTSLLPQCGVNLTGNVSSFIATGRGGAPPVPGGFSADFGPESFAEAPPVK